jgi:hypothetical protein
MSFEMRAILKSKQALRQRLAARPFAEKLRLLEELRERALAIAASRKPAKAPAK